MNDDDLCSIQKVIAERDALKREVLDLQGAMQYASAEMRHAYRIGNRDWNLVARAITILERATK